MTTTLDRLDRMEGELRRLQRELTELRVEVASPPETAPLRTIPQVPPAPDPAPAPAPAASSAPEPTYEPAPARTPSFWSREVVLPRLAAADLLGARGLALAGGIVTLLGVVFFFALAASNGWIGPVARVLLGAGASSILFAAGILVHQRYGRLHASVAAAGAGIAGGYATLLFAAARYELVPPLGALVVAAAIAAIAVALSLHWSSEIVAALGLIGAMAVPAVALLDDTATATGTTFVAFVFLGTVIVALRQRWDGLLIAAGAVSVPQLAVLVFDEGEPAQARALVVAAAFGLLYLGTGIATQLRIGGPRLDSLAGAFAGGNVAVTLLSCFVLLDGDARGITLAAAAAIYAGVAIGLRREVELSALASAAASALAAVALAQLLDGPALVVAWAAETVALAWLGRRIGDLRFQLLALGYLILALGYTVVAEAEPGLLFMGDGDYLAGVPALLAVSAGAIGYGLLAGAWPPARDTGSMPTFLREAVQYLQEVRRELRIAVLSLGALLAIDAASLATLAGVDEAGVVPAFEWGHVAVTGLWGLTGVAALALGLVRGTRSFEIAGLVWLAVTLSSFTFDQHGEEVGWAALALAAALVVAALLHGLLSGSERLIPAGAVAAGAILSGFAAVDLLDGDARGYALVGAAAGYAFISAAVFRRRDLATPFWVAALALALGGSVILLDGTWLVLSWTVGAAAASWLGRLVNEPRLWLASLPLLAFAASETLVSLAPPIDFLDASTTPASGVPALLLLVCSTAAVGFALTRIEQPGDAVDTWIDSAVDQLRTGARWAAPVLTLYAASLAILELAQWIGNAALETEFQRGHTGVSALWGAVALVAVVVGLRRGSQTLRLAGLGLFGTALVKLFLYDLSTLSSVARAASFLAVGAVLLLAGFFYQRLSADPPASGA